MIPQTLVSRRILLIIGGGIAAYKSLDLIRRLRERGASVQAVLTAAGKQFVTPLSVGALTGGRVHDDLFALTDEAQMGHIELSRDADLVVVAPATADLMAKMAQGLANDLASTLLLATDKRTLLAPAMNLRMWLHPSTQRTITTLKGDGVLFVGPGDGEMACGEYGPGRMAEPLEIVAAVEAALRQPTQLPLPAGTARHPGTSKPGLLAGKRVVITSGPTHEAIDPVRYIANRSSGKQGHAIAAAAAAAGAEVVLVCGPVAIADPAGVDARHVESALDMLAAVESALPADIFISVAAVADWRAEMTGREKIKKGSKAGPLTLRLVENPDILATIAHRTQDRPALVIGFAAETEQLADHARAKLASKGCDLIVANDVSTGSNVMGGDHNSVRLISKQGDEVWPRLSKTEVARRLIAHIAGMLA